MLVRGFVVERKWLINKNGKTVTKQRNTAVENNYEKRWVVSLVCKELIYKISRVVWTQGKLSNWKNDMDMMNRYRNLNDDDDDVTRWRHTASRSWCVMHPLYASNIPRGVDGGIFLFSCYVIENWHMILRQNDVELRVSVFSFSCEIIELQVLIKYYRGVCIARQESVMSEIVARSLMLTFSNFEKKKVCR